MATSPTEHLLDLDTLAPPASVRIDGQTYVLLSPDALCALDVRRLQNFIPQLEARWGKPDDQLTDEDKTEVSRIIDAICRIVLQAPQEVHAKLTDVHRTAVYYSFLGLPSVTLQQVAVFMGLGAPPPATSTGANSSPVSPASIPAAARSTGSRGSRRRSSSPVSG
jgi:hypothetical protein